MYSEIKKKKRLNKAILGLQKYQPLHTRGAMHEARAGERFVTICYGTLCYKKRSRALHNVPNACL